MKKEWKITVAAVCIAVGTLAALKIAVDRIGISPVLLEADARTSQHIPSDWLMEMEKYITGIQVYTGMDRAFASTNTFQVERLEIDDGNSVEIVEIDSGRPFAIILSDHAGEITFYDTEGNPVEHRG